MTLKGQRLAGTLVAILIPVVVWAGQVVLPFTFQSGDPIRASEMNANFAALKQAVDDLDSRVGAGGASPVRTGTRLKALVMESDDGLSMPVAPNFYPAFYGVFWDSQLQTTCLISPDFARYRTCVPYLVASLAFTDSNCQTEAGVINETFVNNIAVFAGDAGVRNYATKSTPDGGYEVWELGAASAMLVQTYASYSQIQTLPDGGSQMTMGCSSQQPARTAPLIRMVPASSLAQISFAVR